jgi:hypothetical protein
MKKLLICVLLVVGVVFAVQSEEIALASSIPFDRAYGMVFSLEDYYFLTVSTIASQTGYSYTLINNPNSEHRRIMQATWNAMSKEPHTLQQGWLSTMAY